MNEDLINFIWRFRLFRQKTLLTSRNEPIEIISPGFYNSHAGPDFTDVKVRIGSTTWIGSAEIHIRASDWERHGHSGDKAYNNVILHVVYENDLRMLRADGTEPSVFVIKPYIPENIQEHYLQLIRNMNWIPCEKQLSRVDPIYVEDCLQRMLIERMEEKSEQVAELLNRNQGDWSETFYILLCRTFGFKLNVLPFELLARSLPMRILERHRDSLFQLEALLFGQAGFLEEPASDEYILSLQEEYRYLRHKYSLTPIESYLWKYLRLRPQNFPAVRLAQFASLIHRSPHLFSRILETREPVALRKLFEGISMSSYWQNHNKPGKESAKIAAGLGRESVNNILINTVSVALYSYGKYTDNSHFFSRSICLLESIPAETNRIVLKYREIGVKSMSADSSQALLQLKKKYCDQKKCVNCAVGARIINSA
ncbi:uncharacterized protein DUF2851 [Arcticibacter pallidicorallinus]|uniref:Uncharacterized protein DUF2851 n=1 Tax=Arcticibacter pallidicorallinus TaxID=1259464 RepID=A0A2T0UCD5_9SPHI|nr:DUF2851 family protein [Arcticibacter pallidicorallinus]PRY55477.1 uncharacterized protein DUF2851 [Arcticibacter pallidicorallinus]